MQVDFADPAAIIFRDPLDHAIFDYIGWVRAPKDGSPLQYTTCLELFSCGWVPFDQLGTTTQGELPPSPAVENTVIGADTAIENLAQSIANSDAPNYCADDVDCVAVGINDPNARAIPDPTLESGPGSSSWGQQEHKDGSVPLPSI